MYEHPFAALHAPVAPFTWEVRASLATAQRATGAVPCHFHRNGVTIVGFRPSVTPVLPLAGGGLVVPTAEDVEVLIGVNNRERLTNQVQETTPAGAGESFVTLASLDVFTPRLLCYEIPAAGSVNFEFRWKQFVGAAAPFEACLIGLTMFCRMK